MRIEGAKKKLVFATELSKSYDAADMAVIRDKVRNAPENIRILWNLAEGQMKILDKNYYDTAHYATADKGVRLNYFKDTVDNPRQYGIAPHCTLFHELGHLIDHFMGRQVYFHSEYFKGWKFGYTLRQEAEDYINATLNRLKREALAAGKSAKSIKKADAYDFIEKEITSMEHRQKADVSDIWEGATNGKVSDGWGHGKKYWKADSYNLTREAFAEMFCAVINKPESLLQIKRYFPESYKVFEEMIEEFVKNATKI